MSTHAVPPASSIDLTNLDPSLTTDLQHHNPLVLQHGLIHADGTVRVKPEIAAKLDDKIAVRATRLIAAGRLAEANSLVGCRNIQNVTSHCPQNHEAEHAPILCGKPLLHEPCATPKARVSKFAYEHPALYAHLMESSFQVLTFTMPGQGDTRYACADARLRFRRFVGKLDGAHGWQWLAGFSRGFDGVTFYAIHEGDRLPYWPEMNALWRRVAGNSATLRIRTFDGRDGDSQRDGLLLANSGFLLYWDAIGDRELEMAAEMRDEDLTALYGTFRGFEPRSPAGDAKPTPELPVCVTCGRRHVPGHGTLLLTMDELSQRFDHIRPPSYGQRHRQRFGNAMTMATVAPSPPPG